MSLPERIVRRVPQHCPYISVSHLQLQPKPDISYMVRELCSAISAPVPESPLCRRITHVHLCRSFGLQSKDTLRRFAVAADIEVYPRRCDVLVEMLLVLISAYCTGSAM